MHITKEAIKSKEFLIQNIQEIWALWKQNKTKQINLRIIEIEEKDTLLQGWENIFKKKKIHRKILPQPKERDV
jgi:molybdenum cofactor biosynthesis enzyme MoaA